MIEGLRNARTAIILTTHHLEEAEYLSNDVIIIDKGHLEIRGSPHEICQRFGIGYRITVDSLEQEHDVRSIKSLTSKILKMDPAAISFNESSFLTQGKVDFVIPLDVKD